MGSHRFIQLDIFTTQPFAGNPLAVFPEAEGLAGDQMLKIAREMNLSEAVFVLKPDNASGGHSANGPSTEQDEVAASKTPKTENQASTVLPRLRIFTPAREIPFAGHPVVGSWNALAREGIVPLPDGGNGWTRIYHEVGIGILPVDIEFINIEVKDKPGAIEEVRVGGPSVVVAHGEVVF